MPQKNYMANHILKASKTGHTQMGHAPRSKTFIDYRSDLSI